MNIREISLGAVLSLLFLLPAVALGVNKCTDATGHVSYQSGTCPVSQATDHVQVDGVQVAGASPAQSPAGELAPGEVGSVVISVPGVGNVGIMVSSDWKVLKREEPPVSTVKVSGWAMIIQLTFLPRPGSMDEEAHKESVRQMGERYLSSSVEPAVQLRRLATGVGPAILANFNERKYQVEEVPAGEYSSITIGQINHERMTVAVTILTNGSDTVQHDNALLVLESILLIQ